MRLGNGRGRLLHLAGQGPGGKGGALLAAELVQRQYRRVAPHGNVGLARLGLGAEQEVGKNLCTLLGGGVHRDRYEVRVANGSATELVADDAGREPLGGDFVGRVVGVEGQCQLQLAIGQHLAHGFSVLRELLASAPQVRVQLVQRGPQGGSRFGKCFGRDWLVERAAVGVHVGQHLLHKGGAMEVGRTRVGHAAWVGLGKGQQLGQVPGWLGRALAVGHEGELGHAPGCFHALGGLGKVQSCGGLALRVHLGIRRQAFGKRAKQQAFALHGQEVFAVDPHQVHAALGFAGSFLIAHAFDHVGCVSDLHVLHRHAIALLHLGRGPLDVGVDGLGTAPGVEVHRLTFCSVFYSCPRRFREGCRRK